VCTALCRHKPVSASHKAIVPDASALSRVRGHFEISSKRVTSTVWSASTMVATGAEDATPLSPLQSHLHNYEKS
jgi:hypothetical protein